MSTTRSNLGVNTAVLLALATGLGGCFANPDFSQITCKTDKQCPPGFQCDLTRNKCTASVDAALLSEVGPGSWDMSGEHSPVNGGAKDADREVGVPMDGASSVDLPGSDLPWVLDLAATDVSAIQDSASTEALPPADTHSVDATSKQDLRQPDVPSTQDLPSSLPEVEVPADLAKDIAPASCLILGTSYDSDKVNPSNPCQSCQLANPTTWSSLPDGTGCPGSGKYCSAGTCKNGCFIAGAFYADGAVNGCQTCKTASPTAWSKLEDGTSCGGGRVCADGSCKVGCWVNGSLLNEGQSVSCSATGSLGTCASGTRTCTSGQLSNCSIQPASGDTCTIGNDDNCNGTPNDTACKVTRIATGGNHTCAVLSDGMVRCWGENGSGQLGDGSTTFSSKPVLVRGLRNVASVTAGANNTCALISDGSLNCWGDNSGGQLGTMPSSTPYSSLPVALSPTTSAPASAVAVGTAHICYVVKSDGTVRCLGQSSYGRLGNGTTTTGPVTTPVTVTGLSNVASISAGYSHTCVSLTDLSVRCWGQDNLGQMGDGGSTTPASTPVIIKDHGYPMSIMISVVSGPSGDHVCSLRNDGEAVCWGRGSSGQLGDGVIRDASPNPVPVLTSDLSDNIRGMVSMAAGANHTCAVMVDSTGLCWGKNSDGQLGNSSNVDAPLAVAIAQLTNLNQIAAGAAHTCAVLTDGTARCWGANNLGQLGDATVTPRSAPVAVKNLLP